MLQGQWFAIILLILAILSVSPAWDYVKGYKVLVGIQDTPEQLREDNGKYFLMAEVKNEGGYDLHNVSGELSYSCTQFSETRGGTGRLESRFTILPKGNPDFLKFEEGTLVGLIKNNSKKCSDAFLLTAYYNHSDLTSGDLMYWDAFEFYNDGTTTKNRYASGDKIASNLCIYCDIKVSVLANEIINPKKFFILDEGSFTTNKSTTYAGWLMDWNSPPEKIRIKDSASSSVIWSVYGNLNYDFCNDLEDCGNYLCEIINRDYDAQIACDQVISSFDVTVKVGSGGMCSIPVSCV